MKKRLNYIQPRTEIVNVEPSSHFMMASFNNKMSKIVNGKSSFNPVGGNLNMGSDTWDDEEEDY